MPVCGEVDDMQYFIFVILILAVVSLIILLRQKENQLKGLKQQLGETQDIIKRSDAKKNKLEEMKKSKTGFGTMEIQFIYMQLSAKRRLAIRL